MVRGNVLDRAFKMFFTNSQSYTKICTYIFSCFSTNCQSHDKVCKKGPRPITDPKPNTTPKPPVHQELKPCNNDFDCAFDELCSYRYG